MAARRMVERPVTDREYRDRYLRAMVAYAAQPPELRSEDWSEGGYRKAMADVRADLRCVRVLAGYVERSMMTAAGLLLGVGDGRLSVSYAPHRDEVSVSYVAGQNWPTEFRAAVREALADAIVMHESAQQRERGERVDRRELLEAVRRELTANVGRVVADAVMGRAFHGE